MKVRARSPRTWVSQRSLVFALWGIAFSWGAPALAATGDGSLTDPNLTFVGRWDKSSSAAYVSNWGGAYVTTKFTGSHVAVKLTSPVTFKYILDGKLGTYWAWGSNGTISLPTAQGSGPHTLQIAAHWEDKKLPFQGLALDPGEKTLPPDARPTIEFIGDSITAGLQTTHGALSDYAWLTAEQLSANHTQIAVSGITLVNGYHHPEGPWPGMESLYFKSKSAVDCKDVACANNPPWSFANDEPKLVVINLGTNDGFLHVAGDAVQRQYINFLQNVRAKRPNAEIFVLRTFGDYYVTQTQAAVNARVAAGDSKVHFIDTKGWIVQSDTADTIHPNDAGHQKITALLAPILRPYLSASTTVNANLVSNPGFENGLSGWTVLSAGASQAYTETWGANSGTSHLTHWSATPYWAATYQTVSGLSNGLYTVKAWVRGTGGQQLYIKYYGGTQMSATLSASDAYRQVVISDVLVTNGSAELGFWSYDVHGNGWLNVDDVSFYKQ
jgi:lysophospholipase L1-like esterase